jgi:hyperosmotically inducible periplasmic protein
MLDALSARSAGGEPRKFGSAWRMRPLSGVATSRESPNDFQEITMKSIMWLKTLSVGAACMVALAGCAGNSTQRSTGQYVDDKTISTKVKTALIEDKQVKARDIDVATYKGVVALSGFVDSQSEADRAAEVAEKVDGVQSVRNDLHVRQ